MLQIQEQNADSGLRAGSQILIASETLARIAWPSQDRGRDSPKRATRSGKIEDKTAEDSFELGIQRPVTDKPKSVART